MTSLRVEGDRRVCPAGVVIACDDESGIWAMRAIAIDRKFVIEGRAAQVDFHKVVGWSSPAIPDVVIDLARAEEEARRRCDSIRRRSNRGVCGDAISRNRLGKIAVVVRGLRICKRSANAEHSRRDQ